jgi:Fe2+ transport system protein FeoA
MATLADLAPTERARLLTIGGERHFRRRLLELGFVPGAVVTLKKVAPLGDPLELEVRHCRVSIRRAEAAAITVERLA